MTSNGINGINGTNGAKLAVTMHDANHETASNVTSLQSFLDSHPSVRFIRFLILDYGSILRVHLMTTARALQIAANPTSGVSTASPVTNALLPTGGIILEFFQSGEDIWLPDWSSLHGCGAAAPAHASVMCFVEERVQVVEEGKEMEVTSSTERDPRSALCRVLEEAKEKHGVDFLVGTEVEFILLENVKSKEPLDTPGGMWSTATIRTPSFGSVVEESVLVLEAAGIPVWTFHTEGMPGKSEIALSPMPPLQAADALKFCHETIKSMALKHGCLATFHPKPFEKGPTAGSHIHISLSKPSHGEAFLAGLLQHFRALSALMQPSFDSYKGRYDQMGCGWVQWGWMNKLNPIKRIKDAYFEIRAPDGTANTYLMLAGIIGVGMHAVEAGERLTIKSNAAFCGQEELSDEARRALGITDHLPRSMAEAVAAMKEDEVLKRVLGEKCFDTYVLFKEKELAAWKGMTSDERREALIVDL